MLCNNIILLRTAPLLHLQSGLAEPRGWLVSYCSAVVQGACLIFVLCAGDCRDESINLRELLGSTPSSGTSKDSTAVKKPASPPKPATASTKTTKPVATVMPKPAGYSSSKSASVAVPSAPAAAPAATPAPAAPSAAASFFQLLSSLGKLAQSLPKSSPAPAANKTALSDWTKSSSPVTAK